MFEFTQSPLICLIFSHFIQNVAVVERACDFFWPLLQDVGRASSIISLYAIHILYICFIIIGLYATSARCRSGFEYYQLVCNPHTIYICFIIICLYATSVHYLGLKINMHFFFLLLGSFQEL